jgi:anaerobic selenocysteine-containing dehydrogenase
MAILAVGVQPGVPPCRPPNFAEALSKVPFTVAFASFLDETSSLADLVLPVPTFLETWGDDIAPVGHAGAVTLRQPVVAPFRDAKPMADVLLAAAAELGGDVAKALPWKSMRECIAKAYGGPGSAFDDALRDGGIFPGAGNPGRAIRREKAHAPRNGKARPATIRGSTRWRCTCSRPSPSTTAGGPTFPGSRSSRTPSPRRGGGTGWS